MARNKHAKPLAPNSSAQAKDIVVREWRVTKRDVLRVMIREFKGHKLIDVRRWYRDADGKLCPGKGISCRPPDIERLRKALRKADRLLNGRP
jgi:hypothetical protein